MGRGSFLHRVTGSFSLVDAATFILFGSIVTFPFVLKVVFVFLVCFQIEGVLLVFQSMDHCAIFILIAGTYSPYFCLSLIRKPFFYYKIILLFLRFCMLFASDDMIHLMKVQWSICLIGVTVYLLSLYGTWGKTRVYQVFELGLYVLMGNYVFLYWHQFMDNACPNTRQCLLQGGSQIQVF